MSPTIHALTTSAQTIYTCGTNGNTGKLGLIKSIDVTNTTAAALTVTIYLVPFGGTPAASNALYFGTSVAANSILSWRGTQILAAGGMIQALSSGAGLTINAAGGEYAPTL
jgi:hypothetical protein